MRPQSIVLFERLFLASLAVDAIFTAVTYDESVRALAADPQMQQLGLGGGFVIGLVVARLAFYLLLWFLIARKAVNAAKWILVVCAAIGVATMLPVLTHASYGTATLASLAAELLELAAIVFLFRADATAWLKGGHAADPATSD